MCAASPRRRLLFLTPFAPHPDLPHGGRTTAHLIAKLAETNDVAIVCSRETDELPVSDDLAARCDLVDEVVVEHPHRGALDRQVYRARLAAGLLRGRPMWTIHGDVPGYRSRARAAVESWRPDVIQLEVRVMTQYLDALPDTQAQRILVDHDPLGHTEGVHGGRRKRLTHWADTLAWRRLDRGTRDMLDAVVVFTQRDAEALAASGGRPPVVIPLAVPVADEPLGPGDDEPPRMVFVGGYLHPPNHDAAMRLLRSIFPRVRAAAPNAILELVGDDPSDEMRAAAGEGVVIAGRVPSVLPHLARASVVVAPVHFGGGMRLKVIEALGAAKAVVATKRAVDGLAVDDGVQLLIRNSDADIADATLGLFANAAQRGALGRAGREWVQQNISVDAVAAAYARLYETLLAEGAVR